MELTLSLDCTVDDLIEYDPHSTDDEDGEYDTSQSDAYADGRSIDSPDSGAENDAVQCKLCLAQLASMDELTVHFLLEHHGTTAEARVWEVSEEQVKTMRNVRLKYLCGLCGVESFNTMRETKRHMFEEHGYEAEDARDSGADYSPDEDEQEVRPDSVKSTDTGVSVGGSDNDSIDGVSSGIISGMSPSTTYISSPDSRTRRRSLSCSSSEYEEVKTPLPAQSPMQPMEQYFRSVTLKTMIQKFKSEAHHRCSRKGCQYKFVTTDARERHLECHVDEPTRAVDGRGVANAGATRKRFTFRCSQCEQRFDSWKPCMLHLWNVHQVDLGALRCPLCEKRFAYVVHVFIHLQTHRPKEMRDVACRVCGQKFANRSQRSVHEALHRKRGERPLAVVQEESEESAVEEARLPEPKRSIPSHAEPRKSTARSKPVASSGGCRRCKLCKRTFSNVKILSKHVKTVHFKIKPFNCNVCGYKCARKLTLNIHMRQHTGVKPLACQICPFRTADPSALYYHVRRHGEEKPYKCRTCGFSAVQPSVLKKHIQTQHPHEYGRMQCRLCGFTSINPQSLRRHQADHEAGLIATESSRSGAGAADVGMREKDPPRQSGTVGTHNSTERAVRSGGERIKNVPEVSLDCFLPPESADSMVHDAGGITIPAVADGPAPVAHSEDTQFPS